ncbi:low molecular weight protein-tyrosine-phosphatase [Soonwooa sp.]|uniref:low molecular weight protein-tyrosine-phosphatase n=1 Tax=Soonwooa sp. TaxID=1938592 RepID=UPI00289DCEE0|nr:low molecular weight protein-tyrosine-phosphatase [Soonwooa sp.]
MKILMLCLGNICRSPLAEGILRSKLSSDFEVDSAGTISMHEGEKADKRSIKVAANHHVDINEHRSRPITAKDFENFDRIYCMDLHNLEDALSMAKNDEQRAKVSLILDVLNSGKSNEVPDPYWGDLSDFEKVYQMLDEACDVIAKEINFNSKTI